MGKTSLSFPKPRYLSTLPVVVEFVEPEQTNADTVRCHHNLHVNKFLNNMQLQFTNIMMQQFILDDSFLFSIQSINLVIRNFLIQIKKTQLNQNEF